MSTRKSLFVTGKAAGFTLIELLVAVAVAAILSGMAIVSLNIGGYDDRLRDEARRLFQLTRIATDDAVFKTAQYGVRLTHNDYAFYRLQDVPVSDQGSNDGKDTERRWLLVDDDPKLRVREWPEELEVEVFVEGLPVVLEEARDEKAESEKKDLKPHLMFLSNGETLPDVEIHLRSTESEKAWRVGISEEGVMAMTLIDE